MELNSQRTGLGHQHGRRSIVLGHQYGPRDVMCKHSISWFKVTLLRATSCHGFLAHFVNIVNYASLCAMELNLNKEITCKRQNQSFLFNKYTSKALYQTLQTTKMNFSKTHNCNPF